MNLSEVELQDRLRYWQKTLRLQDWTITVEILRARDLHNSSTLGETWRSPNCKGAKIRLLDPIDYDPDVSIPYDMEETLIHELLHCVCWSWQPKSISKDTAMEQAINAIAAGLKELWDTVQIHIRVADEYEKRAESVGITINVNAESVSGSSVEHVRRVMKQHIDAVGTRQKSTGH